MAMDGFGITLLSSLVPAGSVWEGGLMRLPLRR
jgi:hypothetical protein